jgi:hypothetical protein
MEAMSLLANEIANKSYLTLIAIPVTLEALS